MMVRIQGEPAIQVRCYVVEYPFDLERAFRQYRNCKTSLSCPLVSGPQKQRHNSDRYKSISDNAPFIFCLRERVFEFQSTPGARLPYLPEVTCNDPCFIEKEALPHRQTARLWNAVGENRCFSVCSLNLTVAVIIIIADVLFISMYKTTNN